MSRHDELELAQAEIAHLAAENARLAAENARLAAESAHLAAESTHLVAESARLATRAAEAEQHMAERLRAEERARTILESVRDAFFSLDREFRFTYLNPQAERLLLRASSELLGKVVWDEFPAAVGTTFDREYRRAMHERVPVQFVEHYPAPLDRWYEVRADPAAEGLSVYFQDITERLAAERERARVQEEVRRGRDQMELVVRSANVGVWYCPLPFDVLVWDATVKEHFHLPPDAAVTIDTFYERLHPDDREAARHAIERSIAERSSYDIDYRTLSPDGRAVKWIRALGRVFLDRDGNPTQFDGVTIDVSDRKRTEIALREGEARIVAAERAARAEAEQQSRMKDEFLATLSHELRTPLNAILGWAALARKGAQVPPETGRALEVIERNAVAQARIVEDLLDMTSILSGKIRLDLRPVDVADAVVAAVASARPAADEKAVALDVELGGSRSRVEGDPARLQQVFSNLLGNAIKFSRVGGRIAVRAATHGGRVEVHVVDEGEGIAPAFLPHVFERFRQADSSSTRRHGGLGLGLSIVQQIVELHGGTVHAGSDGEGRGATFTVSLPSCAAQAASDPSRARARQPAPDPTDLSELRVLVVDDEVDARMLVAHILEERRAVVTTVATVEDALREVRAGRCDLVIADVGMPGEDGYALARRLRGLDDRDRRATPAIALTAYTRREDRDAAAAAGFDLHVAKPVRAAELVRAVARLARGSREPQTRP